MKDGSKTHPSAYHTQESKIGRPTLARICCGWEPCICEQLARAHVDKPKSLRTCLSRMWGGLAVHAAYVRKLLETGELPPVEPT